MTQDQQLRSALIEVLDGLGALSSPHELEGYGIDAERAKEIVGLTAQQAAPSQGELKPEDLHVEPLLVNVGGFALRGGQGVRVTHVPSGVSVTVSAERSQHRNREIAIHRLTSLLEASAQREQPAEHILGVGPSIAQTIANAAVSTVQPAASNPEPEVVAWGALSADGNIYDVICPETHAQEPGDYTIALITLQSHREAIAKKDAALKECVEALMLARNKLCRVNDPIESHVADAAITQTEEAHG